MEMSFTPQGSSENMQFQTTFLSFCNELLFINQDWYSFLIYLFDL